MEIPMPSIVAVVVLAVLLTKYLVLDALYLSPLSQIPGPRWYALTKWRLAYEDWKGTSTRTLDGLHREYGPAVRIGPNQVSFASMSALRSIYGPGNRYGRTAFYRMFDVYGRQNLFTFHSAADHGRRKKLLSHAYSKSAVLQESTSRMVEDRTSEYLDLIESEPERTSDIFATLHYYSLDSITAFIYGRYGATEAIRGDVAHRALIGDMLDPSRRSLSWSAVHAPALTRWLYTRTGAVERMVRPVLPMKKPATYTGIREHALLAVNRFKAMAEKVSATNDSPPVLQRLWTHHTSNEPGGLSDLDIASECADHFLAGIDTTSDTLMFLIWSLSQVRNRSYQDRLRDELLRIDEGELNDDGNPTAQASDRCTYLAAVIRETLRLYAPLPTFEPRSCPADSVVDGYAIPANTIVGMSPFTLHRNPGVFKDPQNFNPDRWLGQDTTEMNRWFWAFSSGGRMCIGLHLAMVEMTTLAAAIYRKYRTSLPPGLDDTTPGITARFELFYDDSFPNIK
ncbi:Cytochrome P450, partial [Geosmithia morbida]